MAQGREDINVHTSLGCPSCRQGRPIEITLTIAGRQVQMRACSECDTRWWQADGKAAALPDVLALAADGRR
jgi:hypothetical protein